MRLMRSMVAYIVTMGRHQPTEHPFCKAKHSCLVFRERLWLEARRNNGDDQYLCRWLENHGWETEFLPVSKGAVYTGTRSDWTLLAQLLRWCRGDCDSNLSAMLMERKIWT